MSQLTAKREDQARLVRQLRDKIDVIPEIDAELKRLTRNYDVYSQQHNELLQRLETAKLTEKVDDNRRGLKFRVFDPPSVGSNPVGPPRKLFIAGGLIFAIIAGAGFAFLRSIISPVFFSSRKLERAMGIPVIGAVRIFPSSSELAKSRSEIVRFSVATFGFVGCFLVVLSFDQTGSQWVSTLLSWVG